VVLNRDAGAHLRNLKTTPPIEESASACVECGFCEPVCPSRNLTTTPRQRIVLRREMARQPAGSPVQKALLKEFEYEAMETCATDGSCRLACPVGIDTGLFIKEMRGRRHTERAEKLALATAKRWGTVEGAARAALRLAPLARRTKRGKALPPPAPRGLPPTIHTGAAAVYLPSCTNRILASPVDGPISHDAGGISAHRPWVLEALVAVSARAGLPVWIPQDVVGACCGLPWSSKGFDAAHRHKANEMVERLWGWSGAGALPIVVDAASCTGSIAAPGDGVLSEANAERLAQLEVLDSVAWAHDRLLPWLEVGEKVGSAAVHPTCATRQLGLTYRLEALADALAEDVFVPPTATCCGFAGDRGISHPQLTASATSTEASEVAGRPFDAHLSSNRTCEIGLERATGAPYESIILLLERLTRSG
jgi:D-lactate dehydrogenase